MKSHALPFSRKWRQFRFLSKKLNRLLESGKFKLLSKPKQRKLLNRLKELYSILNGVFSTYRLKKALAGATFLLGLAFSNTAAAQTFAAGVSNPFGINLDDFSIPNFVDIDDDGDLDMFISTYNSVSYAYEVKFVENIGSADSPDFAGQQGVDMPFGIQLQNLDTESIIVLDFADMDNDGDQDLIVGGTSNPDYYGITVYFENVGSATQPDFGIPVSNPFGFQSTDEVAFSDLVDIDNDGDFDLMVTEDYANTQFFENVGTPEAPMFAAPVQNPFGISNPANSYGSLFDMADIDGDGDQDLLKIVTQFFSSTFYYQENIGTPTEPDFAAPVINAFGMNGLIGLIAYPHAADIDSDGDIDVFFANGTYNGGLVSEMLFYENVTPLSNNDLLKESTLKFGPNPAADFISLQSEVINENVEINLSLMNMAGQVFQQQTIQSVGNKINWEANIRHLPAGSYLLRLDADANFGVIPFQKI